MSRPAPRTAVRRSSPRRTGGDLARLLALAAVTASIATGRPTALRRALAAAIRRRVPTLWIDEAILQSVLFAGYPRTIQAFDLWRRLSPASRATRRPEPSLGQRRAQGAVLCRRIYSAQAFPRLVGYMQGLHPSLAAGMIEEGYGRLLSRSGLDARQREFALLPILAAHGAWPQLMPHVRGAVRCGATAAEIQHLWRSLRGWIPESLRRKAARASTLALAGFRP